MSKHRAFVLNMAFALVSLVAANPAVAQTFRRLQPLDRHFSGHAGGERL